MFAVAFAAATFLLMKSAVHCRHCGRRTLSREVIVRHVIITDERCTGCPHRHINVYS